MNGNLLYGSGNSNGLCINLEGWDGEGVEREVQKGGDICIPMADSCWVWQKTTKFCKAIILQLKKFFSIIILRSKVFYYVSPVYSQPECKVPNGWGFCLYFLIHFYVPITLNSGWHLIDSQCMFVERLIAYFYSQHLTELLWQRRHFIWGTQSYHYSQQLHILILIY